MLIQDNPLGFSKAGSGGHSARSMMFLEMRALVRAMPLTATKNDFTKAIVLENILENPPASNPTIPGSGAPKPPAPTPLVERNLSATAGMDVHLILAAKKAAIGALP